MRSFYEIIPNCPYLWLVTQSAPLLMQIGTQGPNGRESAIDSRQNLVKSNQPWKLIFLWKIAHAAVWTISSLPVFLVIQRWMERVFLCKCNVYSHHGIYRTFFTSLDIYFHMFVHVNILNVFDLFLSISPVAQLRPSLLLLLLLLFLLCFVFFFLFLLVLFFFLLLVGLASFWFSCLLQLFPLCQKATKPQKPRHLAGPASKKKQYIHDHHDHLQQQHQQQHQQRRQQQHPSPSPWSVSNIPGIPYQVGIHGRNPWSFQTLLEMEIILAGDWVSSSELGLGITLPETNIAPENGWLEYYFPIGEAYFRGIR